MPVMRSKTKSAANDVPDDADIESRFEQAKTEFYKIAAGLADKGSAKAREYTDIAASTAGAMKDDVAALSGDALEQFMEQITQLERDVERRVRQKPLQALAVAGAIGFLFAFLSRR